MKIESVKAKVESAKAKLKIWCEQHPTATAIIGTAGTIVIVYGAGHRSGYKKGIRDVCSEHALLTLYGDDNENVSMFVADGCNHTNEDFVKALDDFSKRTTWADSDTVHVVKHVVS